MTAGTTLAGGGALTANHLYLATIEGRGVKASTAVTLLVRGPTAFNKQKSGRHGIVPPVLCYYASPMARRAVMSGGSSAGETRLGVVPISSLLLPSGFSPNGTVY